MGERENGNGGGPAELVGDLLCWLGFHDYRVIESTFGFGPGGSVEKLECRRCGDRTARQS